MLKRFAKCLAALICLCGLLGLGAGAYIGNLAFERFFAASWDVLLGIENHSRDVQLINDEARENGWQNVTITAEDGTVLQGTYIDGEDESGRAVILLHGLYQNRSMCLPYAAIYRKLGYGVLLVDQRGHGESGGKITWGLHEAGDIALWAQWLKEHTPAVKVGLHGVSLGAAMALLYAGSEAGRDTDFVVADSSYGNIVALGREKLAAAGGDERAVWEYDMVMPFFQGAMFYHTRAFLSDIEPAQAVRHISCPVLFLHGQEDRLVPAKTAWSLYANCRSGRKYIHVFADSPHAVSIDTNRREYVSVVRNFLRANE